MANQYRTLTRDIASSLRSQNVDAAAAGVALDAFARALPDGKLKASLGEPGSEQRAAVVEAVEAHLDDTLTRAEEDLGADDDTLSALASVAAEAAFAKDAVALGKCCRDAAQTLGEAEIPLLDRSDQCINQIVVARLRHGTIIAIEATPARWRAPDSLLDLRTHAIDETHTRLNG